MTKTFYITTSIPYMNARAHIGHALEVVQADAIARFWRLFGDPSIDSGLKQVFLLTGTDEHGKKIQEAAASAGKAPQEFVDEMAEYYKKVCDTLGVSYDNLIRTSDKEKHWPVVAELWQKLQKQGDIYKGSYEGYYCVGCEAFLREAEMENGNCIIHKKPVQKISEENYFFRFSKYSKEVERLIREDVIKILPAWRKQEILNLFSDEEVRDVSFSRPVASVGWGIPVPGDESQMIYVWADALVSYLSGAGLKASEILLRQLTDQDDKHSTQDDKTEVSGESEFYKRWPADIHLIGKDIARFHLMIWPALLLALNLEQPRAVYIHGFISVEGEKISKSLGNVVDPLELVERYDSAPSAGSGQAGSPQVGVDPHTKRVYAPSAQERYNTRYGVGVDAVRYYLLREIPSGDDGDFSFARLRERYTADLQNGLGNLVSRVTAVGEKFDAIEIKNPLVEARKVEYENYKKAIGEFELHKALEVIWKIVDESNKLVDESRLWEIARTDEPSSRTSDGFAKLPQSAASEVSLPGRQKARETLEKLAENICVIGILLLPFLPQTAIKVLVAVGIEAKNVLDKKEFSVIFKKPAQSLFPRLNS